MTDFFYMKNGHIFLKVGSCFYILIERIKKIILLLMIDKIIGFILLVVCVLGSFFHYFPPLKIKGGAM